MCTSFLNASFSPTLKLAPQHRKRDSQLLKSYHVINGPYSRQLVPSCHRVVPTSHKEAHHANIGTPDACQKDPLHHHRLTKTAGFLEIKGPHCPVKGFQSLQLHCAPIILPSATALHVLCGDAKRLLPPRQWVGWAVTSHKLPLLDIS